MSLRRLWRAWWMRGVKTRQLRRLDALRRDPHLARDIGVPVAQHRPPPRDFW